MVGSRATGRSALLDHRLTGSVSGVQPGPVGWTLSRIGNTPTGGAGDAMGVISRGFRRRHEQDPELPPGQHLARDFPVLSAGPTPRIRTDEWSFTVTTEAGASRSWT